MFKCNVCGSSAAKDGFVSEVFAVNDRRVLVENIPAQICERCGEAVFSSDTTEKVRTLVHGDERPIRTIAMDVFALR
jgi:HTH-type transcriptional regulator/antitoxin MqsA